MPNPKYSIIVPVYNAAQYLSKCITSVIEQKNTNWELIIVDDGSKDNSLAIAKEFELKDNRIKVFHTDNHGVSSARNTGLDNSTGEYIVFIDSDDIVLDTYLSNFEISDSDCIVTGINVDYKGKINAEQPESLIEIFSKDFGVAINNFSDKSYFRGPCAKAFKREIISRNSIGFNTKMHWGEDYLFVINFLQKAKSLTFVPKSSYIYYFSSVAGKYHMPVSEYIMGCNLTLDTLTEIKNCNSAIALLKQWYYNTFVSFLCRADKETKLEIFNFENFTNVLKILPSDYKFGKLKPIMELLRVCLS